MKGLLISPKRFKLVDGTSLSTSLQSLPKTDSQSFTTSSENTNSPSTPKKQQKYLVFGLGNPGGEYEGTRHNLGFTCVDALCKAYGVNLSNYMSHCSYSDPVQINGKSVYFGEPQTFMNLSGRSVRGLSDYLKIFPQRIFVIHDDLDLPVGSIRLRNKGSSGGQNGVEDILRFMGNDSRLIRIKVGIGRPDVGKDTAKYVLGKFNKEDQAIIKKTIERVKRCVESLLVLPFERACNQFNKSVEQFDKAEQLESQKNSQKRPRDEES